MRILLIDDNETQRAATRRALESATVQVGVQETSSNAPRLSSMAAQGFDCVLVAYHLRGHRALDVTREIRAAGLGIPVILLLDEGEEGFMAEVAGEMGGDFLLQSQLSPRQLFHSVQTAVRANLAEQRAQDVERERAKLLTAERTARSEAEAAQQRLAFLAEASTVLGASLDYATTLSAMAKLAVPRIADWCAVDIRGEDHSIQPLALTCANPAILELARELRQLHPMDAALPFGVRHVLETGRSEIYPDIPETLLAAVSDAHYQTLLRTMAPRSAMIVPLVTRGRILGAISFISAESQRRYGATDLALAEDLARRAAAAVDNARLYRQTQQAREDAEAANRAKDQFLAVLSHELRTPLMPVMATLSALEGDDTLSPRRIRTMVQTIRRNVELEARLIDDLLDLTRISRNKVPLNLETVDAHACLISALDICRTDIRFQRLKTNLDLKAPVHHVHADPARLQQVFWNLLKNAVKFTPPRGKITIRTGNEPAPAASPRLFIEVTDTGIGIDPQALPRIFDAFEQGGQSITRRFGGLGLGLAISKALVDMHGGTLQANSAGLGMGATFIIHLPTVAPLAVRQTKPPRGKTDAAQHGVRILLVDDHRDTATAMKRLLSQRGYNVRTASSVTSALSAAANHEFDLLISDIGLPDGSGLDLLRQLKSARPITGIALSGYGMDEDVQKSKTAGFVEHLTKPVNLQHLEDIIRQLFTHPADKPLPTEKPHQSPSPTPP